MTTVLDRRTLRTGIAWSALNSIALRAGTFVVGIVLARLLAPQLFGVYAVALTVQTVLMSVSDLGLSADLIRSDEPTRRAPTVGTISLVVSGALTLATVLFAGPIAGLFETPAAGPAIAVLAFTLLLAGVGVVPYATLQRSVAQRQLFVIAIIDFGISTIVTLCGLALGWGVLSLAVGRLLAQCSTTTLQFVLARQRPRFGLDRAVLGSVLRFGLPVAGANLLSWGLLNIDNFVIARLVGATELGLYVLAFNISSWPMSVISQVVRSVTLPVFSRSEGDSALARATWLSAALALPAGAALAVLSSPVVLVIYGADWSRSAPVLAALAIFGALRVIFDVFAAFLYARGSSAQVLWVQLTWFAALVVGMLAVTPRFGIVGAAWVHVVTAVVLVAPWYLALLGRKSVRLRALLRGALVPIGASVAGAAAAVLLGRVVHSAPALLIAGILAGGIVYLALAGRWLARVVSARAVREAPIERHTVTVVIPCYNYARFLPSAVGSALGQDGVDVDVVVVDDASSDDSAAVALRLAAADPRVRVIVNDTNRGPVATFNRGLEAATGEFLIRLDADDLLTPGSVARAVALAEAEPDVGLVYGHPVHFFGEPPTKYRADVTRWNVMSGDEWLDLRCRMGVNCITSPEVVMRKSVVDEVGGQRDLAHTHDMEMWMRIARRAGVAFIEGADQAWHREHDLSLSARKVDVMTDFHEREAAYVTLFTDGAGDAARDRERLLVARSALADEAILRFASATSRGRGGSPETDAYEAFAVRMGVDLGTLPHGRQYLAAKSLGPARAPRSVPLVGWAAWNRINVSIKYRRWARTGL